MLKRFFNKKEIPTQAIVVELEPIVSEPIEVKEGILVFENLNFKLAILQILMYDLNVLGTQFDLYEFVDEYQHRPIYLQEEGYDIIPEAIEFFNDFVIDADYAQYITEIAMDPMQEIYTHIYPFWDGCDDLFDITSVSAQELAQFPFLKSASLMGSVQFELLNMKDVVLV